jgi:hypothetical protein
MKRQVITVGASGAVTLAETPVIDATHPFKVMSLDRKTTYVTSTDYTRLDERRSSSRPAARSSAGAPSSSSTVSRTPARTRSESAARRSAPPTFRMDYVIRDDTGKAWQLTFFKALADTDFKMAFSDRESGDFTTHNIGFRALVDITKAEGANLFEIVQEDATA